MLTGLPSSRVNGCENGKAGAHFGAPGEGLLAFGGVWRYNKVEDSG